MFKSPLLLLVFFSSLALGATDSDNWGDDDWSDDEQVEQPQSPWQFSGFIEAAYGGFLQDNIVDSSSSLTDLRARIEADYSHPLFELSAKGDLLYDNVLSRTLWQTRVLNISASPTDNLDIKLGRQVLTWGTGDYVFLNDMFAKDWQTFFSGRDDEYLKAPSDSTRFTYYVSNLTIDLAWTPKFTPDNFLTGERFSFYSPQAQQLVAPAHNFKVNQTDDDQWSARLATSVDGTEYAVYGYRGFWNTPVGVDTQGVSNFPKLNSFGASIRLPVGAGIFSAEIASYVSNVDQQQRLLVGYEREAAKNFTVGLQFYFEKKVEKKVDNAAIDKTNHNRKLLTLRLRYSAMQQKLIYSLFTFYSPTDKDSYIRPSVNYRKDDHWSFSAGANLFGGTYDHSFFGQHQDNSNAWVRVRYNY